MMPAAQARAIIAAALEARGVKPIPPAVQIALAISRFEGNWGAAFGGANNWGAVQSHHRPVDGVCPAGTVYHGDTHADGTPYGACFKAYATPELGAADFVRELTRRPGVKRAMARGSALGTAVAMRAAHYFEAPADRYAHAILRFAERTANDLGEPLAVSMEGSDVPGGGVGSAAQLGGGLLALVGALWWWRRKAR